MVYLAQICKLAYSSIKVYISGVKSQMLRNGLADPTLVNGQPSYKYKLLLRGIQRDAALRAKHTRYPITKKKLIKIIQAISKLNLPHLETLRLKAAVLLAFWGFFRSASYCDSSIEKSVLRRQDICLINSAKGPRYLNVFLRKSKTIQFRSVRVYIYENSAKLLCPVRAMHKFITSTSSIRSLHPKNSLFHLPGNALTLTVFNQLLKRAVGGAGFNPIRYSSHSLRAGAATTAANCGINPYMIKKLGRWNSEAFNVYIKTPKQGILSAQCQM